MVFETNAIIHHSYSSPVELKKQEIPVDPKTGDLDPDAVVIKTAYAALNPVDIKIHSLMFFNKETHTVKDFSGTVVAAGKNAAAKYEAGAKVWGSIFRPGANSFVGTLTLADTKKDVIAAVPPSLTLEQAGAIGVTYGTAYQMLQLAESYGQKLGPESKVLVLGAGTTVGTFVLQLAKKLWNVGTIAVTCSPRSADGLKTLGADVVLDYTKGDLPSQFKQYAAANGKFDAVLDTVGGYDAISVYPEILKPASEKSAYVTVMGDAGPKDTYAKTVSGALLSLPRVFFRVFFGKYFGINYKIFLLSHDDDEWVRRAPEFFSLPGVVIPIDSVYPIADVKEAWAKTDSSKAKGKVVLEFS